MTPSRFRRLLVDNIHAMPLRRRRTRIGRRARTSPRGGFARNRRASNEAAGICEPAGNTNRQRENTDEESFLEIPAGAGHVRADTGRYDRLAHAQDGATVAFLMPDQASTRYEEHDYPGFKAEMEKLCPDCKVLYQNANADVALQQQQFNSVISQGAKVIVLDPVDSTAAASLVKLAQSQGIKVIAYDRPDPRLPADYYVSFDNEGIGKAIADIAGRSI